MIPIICFVFIFFGHISIIEVSSIEECPDAKYSLKDTNGEAVFTSCEEEGSDPCLFNLKTEEMLWVEFLIKAPEDMTDIFYNVSISGDKIDARASGKVTTMSDGSKLVKSFSKKSVAIFRIEAYLEGDLPVGEEGVARVEVYFNEKTKDTPDMCVTNNIKIIEE